MLVRVPYVDKNDNAFYDIIKNELNFDSFFCYEIKNELNFDSFFCYEIKNDLVYVNKKEKFDLKMPKLIKKLYNSAPEEHFMIVELVSDVMFVYINNGEEANYLNEEFSNKQDINLALEKIEAIRKQIIHNKTGKKYFFTVISYSIKFIIKNITESSTKSSLK